MRSRTLPPQTYFAGSALFHYLGPAFAVLLFARVAPLGVAWLRIASAAILFAAWRRPWGALRAADAQTLRLLVALGVVLAAMNSAFYEAIARLPLSTVSAIEFLPVIVLAALGVRSPRNLSAVALAPIVSALGGWQVVPHLLDPITIGAGVGVGISSSVIPYVCDQLAMARLPRHTYSLMVSLLPATATVVGLVVLGQTPSPRQLLGVSLIVVALALHREAATADGAPRPRRDARAGRAGLRRPGTLPSR